MILVDSNVLMYAAGAPHPHKAPSLALLERIAGGEVAAAVDAEALQEILQRYRAIDEWARGRHVYGLARRVFPSVIPVDAHVLDLARELMDAHADLQARDAVHAAVVLQHDMEALCSYDRDFDRVPGIVRRDP